MKPLFSFFLVLVSTGFCFAQVEDDATRPIGFVRQTCPEGSDTWIGTPFEHVKADASVELKSRPRVISSRHIAVFYLLRKQPWTKNQFVGTHYVRIAGNHEWAGRPYKIQSVRRTLIVVEYEDHFPKEDFTRGHEIEVVPYPTVTDIFPPDSQTTFQESDGVLPLQRKTELLIFEDDPSNSTPTPPTSFFVTADGWQQVTSAGIQPANNVMLKPWTAMVIRNKTGLGDTEFVTTGLLPKFPVHTPARGILNERVEIPTPAPVFVPTRLADLQLPTRHNIFGDSETFDEADRAAELLVFDGAIAELNKEPSATYFRVAGQWHLDNGTTYPVSDDVEIQPGTAFSFKKNRTWFHKWVYTPVHLQEEGATE